MALNKDQIKSEFSALRTSLRNAYDAEKARVAAEVARLKNAYDAQRDRLSADRDAGRITSEQRQASRDQILAEYNAQKDALYSNLGNLRQQNDSQISQAQLERDKNLQLASLQASAAREEARIARRNDPEALAAYRQQVADQFRTFDEQFARENPSFATNMQQLQQNTQQLQQGVSNLPSITQAQAPELTREYYLSRGYPESMLPPLPGQATQNVPPLPPSQLTSPTPSAPSAQTGQSFLSGTNMVTPLNPATLPALRGSASGTSSIDPTLRPYLELGLRGAEQLFLQQQPSLYPGQMFVSPSEQTQAALNMQEDIALAQPTSLQAAQEAYMRGLGGLSATAGGAFLMGNPYQQAAIEAASRPIQRQFAETTLPGIASGFSRAGRYGSQAMGTALGSATEATARALGDVGTQIAYGGYEAERGRQQQAMGAQLQAATMAPQIYGQQFLPSQQLAQVGAAREAIAAQPLQEAIQRYQFQQQIPYQQLQGFLSSVYGTPMASSQYAPPAQTNTAASVLGGAATGAGIGRLLQQGGVGDIFGFNPSTFGAVAGGLGGLLF